MSAKDFGLSEKELEEFDNLCERLKDNPADKDAKTKIDNIFSKVKEGVSRFELSQRYYEKTDHKKGNVRLGYYYLEGKVVPRNVKLAAHHFLLAAENGNSTGLLELGKLFEKGYIHVEVFDEPKDEYKDPMKPFEAVMFAAKIMKKRQAMMSLACDYYENGCPGVVERDLDKAIKWVKKATEGKEGDPFVESATLFAGRLFKLDLEKSRDLEKYLRERKEKL